MLEKCRSTEKPLQMDVTVVLYFWRDFVVLGLMKLKVGNSEQICRKKKMFLKALNHCGGSIGDNKQGLSSKYTDFCPCFLVKKAAGNCSSVVIEQEKLQHRPVHFGLRAEPRCLRKTLLRECREIDSPKSYQHLKGQTSFWDMLDCFCSLSHQMAWTQLA